MVVLYFSFQASSKALFCMCPWARHFINHLLLFQPTKYPNIIENCWLGHKVSSQTKQATDHTSPLLVLLLLISLTNSLDQNLSLYLDLNHLTHWLCFWKFFCKKVNRWQQKHEKLSSMQQVIWTWRKPVFSVCEQQRRWPACASAQSYQRLNLLFAYWKVPYLNLLLAKF